jgi:hypothetical protein
MHSECGSGIQETNGMRIRIRKNASTFYPACKMYDWFINNYLNNLILTFLIYRIYGKKKTDPTPPFLSPPPTLLQGYR